MVDAAQKELTQAKAEAARANSRREAAEKESQKQILVLQQQLATAKAAEAEAERPAAATPASRASLAPGPDGSGNSGGPTVVHLSDIVKDHPEYAAIYAKQMRRNIDRMYGGTLDTLNLPPQQLSQLKDLLAERQMSFMDAMRLTSAAGLKQGSPEWQDAMKQASQDVDQQINAILGSNGGATLSQLQTRAGIQSQIAYTYAPDFADAGAPLSAEQSRNLAQVMADATYAGKDLTTRPKGYNEIDPKTGLTPHDSRILDAAAGILSPAQIQILRTDQIENHQTAVIMKQYNKGGGPVTFVP
ncbi:MAG TPA: hypothetical protein VFB27_08900 [Opitutaceae bacterium]|nr:hypothetical protein [Opitutaceae bacterium]